MKKTIIAVVVAVLVVAIGATSIFLVTAKESKQLTKEILNTYYDVSVEITDYVRGEKNTEFLGLISTYKPSTAKIHITITPKDDIICDGGVVIFNFNDDFWKVVNGSNEIKIQLNEEGVTELSVDIEADLKISTIAEPELSTVELTNALGTVTYKKFFNKL
jgi:hypothetical protein